MAAKKAMKKARKQFFFEKKNQKTFVPRSVSLRNAYPKEQKSFASFLQKRSASLLPCRRRGV
jgi:hypothetical protein